MINYVKNVAPIKGACGPFSLAFLFGCDSGDMMDSTGNEELAKSLVTLSESVKSMQEELSTLKRRATQTGATLLSTGLQHSDFDFDASSSSNSPPHKMSKADDEGKDDEEEVIDKGELELIGQLVTLSEGAATFLEAAFNAKLRNDTRKAKATKNRIPDSRWTRCPKMDAMVAANISPGTKRADRSVSRLQQFWLDATVPLVVTLERAEEFNLPPEAIAIRHPDFLATDGQR